MGLLDGTNQSIPMKLSEGVQTEVSGALGPSCRKIPHTRHTGHMEAEEDQATLYYWRSRHNRKARSTAEDLASEEMPMAGILAVHT